MSKSEVDTVAISVDGKELTLTPSAKAMTAVSRAFGGILNAVDSVQRFDVGAMSTVIAIGAGLGDAEKEALAGRIFETGVTELLVPVVRFLGLLATGGRRARATTEGE